MEDYKYRKTIDGITYVDSHDFWLTDVENKELLISENGAVVGHDCGILSAAKITVFRKFLGIDNDERESQVTELTRVFREMNLPERTENVNVTLEQSTYFISFVLVRLENDVDVSNMYFGGQLSIEHTEHSVEVTKKKKRPFYASVGKLVGGSFNVSCRQAAAMCCYQWQSTGVFLIKEDHSGFHWMCPCPGLLVASVPRNDFTSFLMSR